MLFPCFHRIHGFGINSFADDYTYGHMKEQMSQLGIADVDARELMHVHKEYLGKGYGLASDDQLGILPKQ